MGILNSFSPNHLPQRGLVRQTESLEDRLWIVSLDDAKEHLRVLHNDDDTYITSLIYASQLTAEYYSNIDFTSDNWLFTCDTWEQTLSIPYQKVFKITSLKYYDDNGALQGLTANTDFYSDAGSLPARITLTDGTTYPSLRNGTGNILIHFQTDILDYRMDAHAKQAVMIMIADMYENRQSVVVGRIASSIPKTSQYLLDTIKIQTL